MSLDYEKKGDLLGADGWLRLGWRDRPKDWIIDSFPHLCCDCLSKDYRRVELKLFTYGSLRAKIPLCAVCSERWKSRRTRMAFVGFLVAVIAAILDYTFLSNHQMAYKRSVSALRSTAFVAFVTAELIDHFGWPVQVGWLWTGRKVIWIKFRNGAFEAHLRDHSR